MSNIPRNTELDFTSKIVNSDSSQITVGGRVPSGMKRWISFVSIDSATVSRVSDLTVIMASVSVSNPTRASIVATANRKLRMVMEGTQLSRSSRKRPVMFPQSGPNTEAPLFSIAGGNWLGIYASATTANVTVQSFDE